MKEQSTLKNRVRELRTRLDMRQSDLAREIGVTRQTILAIEKGRLNPSINIALKTARVLRAVRPYVWSGGAIGSPVEAPDAVVAAVLPTRDELRQLAAIAPTTVLVLASQLSYLRSIAALTPLTLPSPADRAQDRSAQLRSQIAARLRQGDVDAELAVLAPLYEEHAPAMVAATTIWDLSQR